MLLINALIKIHTMLPVVIMHLLQLSDVTRNFRRHIFGAMMLIGYGVAAISGLVGAIRIYNLWQINGRHHIHIDSEIARWLGASIFFFIATTLVDKIL